MTGCRLSNNSIKRYSWRSLFSQSMSHQGFKTYLTFLLGDKKELLQNTDVSVQSAPTGLLCRVMLTINGNVKVQDILTFS
jgi:hypothetical protein